MSEMSRRGFLAAGSMAALGASSFAATAKQTPRADLRGTSATETFEVGVVRHDVTPPPGQEMWGYSDPEQIATGTRDPLLCRVVVIKAGDTAIGLAALDMGRMPLPYICARIRAKARG